MAKKKAKVKETPEPVEPKPFKVLQPFYIEDHLPKLGSHVGECRCWYCDKVLIKDGLRMVNASSIQLLLSGDFAHRSCQDQVKPGPAYAKARSSYLTWMNRNNKKVLQYLNDPNVKVSVIYFGDNKNAN
jgi:hypothetical protein